MKKFLTIIIICIVTASLGLLTYNFLTVSETIVANNTNFYVNVGEEFKIDYERVNPKNSTKIVVSYDGFETMVQYSDVYKSYTAKEAGQIIFKITSNIKGSAPITIVVNVGNGTVNAPYYISTQEQLANIGKAGSDFSVDANYLLVQDIPMQPTSWSPICVENGFNGKFDFNGFAISNLTINPAETLEYAGLFAKIDKNAVISNVNLKNVNMQGNFTYAGALAGVNNGSIYKAHAEGVTINNTNASVSYNGGLVGYSTGLIQRSEVVHTELPELKISSIVAGNGSYVGGLVGKLETTTSIADAGASILRSNTVRVNLQGEFVGGVAGAVYGGELRDVYSRNCNLVANSNSTTAYVGGLVGENKYASVTLNSITNYIPSTILNAYSANIITESENATEDAVIAKNSQYEVSVEISNIPYINIIWGVYYFGDTGSSVETALTNSDFISVTKINAVTDVTAETFTTNSNLDSVSTIETGVAFDTENAWVIEAGAYPTLNFDGANTISTLQRKGAVSIATMQDLFNEINENPNGRFILLQDIDFAGASFEPIANFNGVLDGNGKTIKNVNVSALTLNEVTYSGIFAQLSSNALVYNLNLENITVSDATFASVLTANNQGTIQNCVIKNSTITANALNENTGIVSAINNGNISNVVLTGNTINVNGANKLTYIGFMVGQNLNIVKDSVVYATNKINVTANVSAYIGGVAGLNNSKTSKAISYVEVGYGYNKDVAGATQDDKAMILSPVSYEKVMVAGLVANNQGEVYNSQVSGYFKAHAFGGLIGIHTLEKESLVAENSVSKNTVAVAKNAGALVYELSQGKIANCKTEATLNCADNSSKISGYVHAMGYNEDNNPTIENCFSATILNGEGERYYESATKALRSVIFASIKYPVGEVINSPYDAEVGNGAISQAAQEDWIKTLINILSSVYEPDIPLTTDECQNPTNDAFTSFDKSVWKLEAGNYPELISIVGENGLNSKVETLITNLI